MEGRGRNAPRLAAVAALATAGLFFGVAPVVGDGLNRVATPNSPVLIATTAATSLQQAGAALNPDALPQATVAGKKKKGKKKSGKKLARLQLESRVTNTPIVTEENQGSYVGVKCPKGSKAISGGVLNKYINLLVSASAPNHPISGKYTPHTWWLTVTNANVDGQGGSLSWRGVVNCLKPVKLVKTANG